MTMFNSKALVLVAGIAAVGLTGCEQLEQAASEAVDNATQAAVQALDEAKQSGSIADAKQSADKLVNDAKQQAAGILDQVNRYLTEGQQALEPDQPTDRTAPEAL